MKLKSSLIRTLICDWFVDNKLSIHFDEDKTKLILFSSKSKIKKTSPLNIQYKGKKVKQYSKVTYLGCNFDETLSGESMATHVINKVNSRLRFLFRFCLKLGDRKSITVKEFEK